MKNTHIHHIIPKHMGGSDEPENLIELTVEEHAEAHRQLFREYGKIQDKIAWKMLSGKTDESEALRKKFAKIKFQEFLNDPVKSKEWKDKISNSLKGRTNTKESNKKRTETLKKWHKQNKEFFLSTFTEERKEKMKETIPLDAMAKGRKTSKKWKDAVTSEKFKKQHSEQMKGREITWGNEISAAKKGKPTKSTKAVTINGILYPSIAEASRKTGIKKHKIKTLMNKLGNVITIN